MFARKLLCLCGDSCVCVETLMLACGDPYACMETLMFSHHKNKPI